MSKKCFNPAGFYYEIIAEEKEYALIKLPNTEEYKIVFSIFGDGSWSYTVNSWYYGKYGDAELKVLQNAIDVFRYKTEIDYICRSRLEELVTQFKDEIIGGETETEEYVESVIMFEDYYDLTENEMRFLGLMEGEEYNVN